MKQAAVFLRYNCLFISQSVFISEAPTSEFRRVLRQTHLLYDCNTEWILLRYGYQPSKRRLAGSFGLLLNLFSKLMAEGLIKL
jgi:hypothetical protein